MADKGHPGRYGNIPGKYQQMVLDAVAKSYARRAADPENMTAKMIADEVYKQIADAAKAGSDDEEFIPGHQLQVAMALRRFATWALKYAAKNPPTHRKGFGEDGHIVTIDAPDLIFVFGGGPVANVPTGSDGLPPADPYVPEDEGDVFEWVSDDEINRARSMLDVVANDIGFGDYTDPFELVRETALRLGGNWGLNGKRGNANDPSKDILAYDFPGYQPQLFDVIVGAGDYGQHIGWAPLPYPQPYGAVFIRP